MQTLQPTSYSTSTTPQTSSFMFWQTALLGKLKIYI